MLHLPYSHPQQFTPINHPDSYNVEYWAHINNQRIGPLTLQQLRTMPLTPETLVWHTGLPAWVKAKEMAELTDLFAPKPPQVRPPRPPQPGLSAPAQSRGPMPPMPPTYLGWSIAALILCCMIPAIVAIIYASKVSSRYSEGDYEGARKASDIAEIWLIISVTLGLVSIPFWVILSML